MAEAIPFILAAAGGTVLAKELGSVDTPGMEEPKVAPVMDEETRRRSEERKLQRRYAGSGRSGTILSGNNNLG